MIRTDYVATIGWWETEKRFGEVAEYPYALDPPARVWPSLDAARTWCERMIDQLPVTAQRITADVSARRVNMSGNQVTATLGVKSVWSWSDQDVAGRDTTSAMYHARSVLEDGLAKMAERSKALRAS